MNQERQSGSGAQMKLVVGLGNPGGRYVGTRHNVGFSVVERVAERLGIAFSHKNWRAEVGEGWHGEHKVVLAKPLTYVNLSGESVRLMVHFFRLELRDLLVVCDDVNLELGRLRLRPAGSSGGHRGLESIISRLGSREFPRLRIGIGRAPGVPLQTYVLSRFSEDELAALLPQLDKAAEAVVSWLEEGVERTMSRYNTPRT